MDLKYIKISSATGSMWYFFNKLTQRCSSWQTIPSLCIDSFLRIQMLPHYPSERVTNLRSRISLTSCFACGSLSLVYTVESLPGLCERVCTCLCTWLLEEIARFGSKHHLWESHTLLLSLHSWQDVWKCEGNRANISLSFCKATKVLPVVIQQYLDCLSQHA